MKKLLLLPILVFLTYAADAQCQASFTSSSAPYNNSLLNVTFNNTSFGGSMNNASTTSLIYFGDNSMTMMSTGMSSVSHTYGAPGTYTVGLRYRKFDSLTNTMICSDSTAHVITVGYTACATAMSVSYGTNGVTTFTASNPAGTPGMTYSWNFGDNTTGTGNPATHTYIANGYYTVTLTATGGGCTYTNSTTIFINVIPINCANTHAAFTTTVNQNNVNINNTSTYFPGYAMQSIYDFGDGSTSTVGYHSYNAAGTYTIKLSVRWLDSITNTVYCSDSVAHNVTVAVPNRISGTTYLDSIFHNGANDSLQVMLVTFNAGTNMLTAVDSQLVLGSVYPYYSFANKPAGNYLVKAFPIYHVVPAVGQLPTYHDSSLYWNLAQTIVHSGAISDNNNIWIRYGTPLAGPGFIGGDVSLGANKGGNAGVEGMNVMLRNANNKVIAMTKTNVNGMYSFSGLPTGTYSLYPESINYATTASAGIVITAAAPSMNSVNFNQDDAQMNIKPRTLGNREISKIKLLTIAPNPAHKSVVVTWSSVQASGAHLQISNIAGQLVVDQEVLHAAQETLDISALKPGIYFLRGTGALQGMAQKLIVE